MVKKRLTMKEMPYEGSDRWRVLDYLKRAGRDVQAAEMVEALGISVWMPSNTAGAYPELMLRVRRGVYRWGGEAQKAELEQKPEHQLVLQRDLGLFQVPALTVVKAAKQKRPRLRLKSDADLIRYHITANRNVFRDGRDYVGDGLDNLMLTERAARKLATHLKVDGVRDDIEESKARAAGEDHVREFNMDLLMPGNCPAGYPVSFDALVDALGLHRRKAMASLKRRSVPHWVQVVSKGVHKYWLTEESAKRFVLESGISKERKKPIADYFIRKEEEAKDYRQRDKEENAVEKADLSQAIASLAQAMTSMVNTQKEMMVEQQKNTAIISNILLKQEGIEERLNKADELVKAADERADEYYHGMTRRIEAMTYEYPYSAHAVSEKVGLYTKAGKPHFMCVRSLAERLSLMDHGLAVYDSESGPHQFVRLNKGGLEVMREWHSECLENGETFFSLPRSKSSSWHIYLTRPDS